MEYLVKDWYGKPCPKVGFEVTKSTSWTFKVSVPTMATTKPMAEPNQYCEGLWKQDVAEWFIVNPKTGRYVECNLAANGAWWMMLFSEPRKRTRVPSFTGVSTQYKLGGNSWEAELFIPESLLLACLGEAKWAHNVCFILGEKPKQYLSLNKLSPKVPDFHLPNEIVIPLVGSLRQ